jgi:hypothetical protein
MKYLKFVLVDKQTGLSILKQPSNNELILPNIENLVSELMITNINTIGYFLGTCPDSSNIEVEGLVIELTETEYNEIKNITILNNSFKCPEKANNKNFRLTLLKNNLLTMFETTIKTMPKEMQIYWEYSADFNRISPFIIEISKLLNLLEVDPETNTNKIDELFIESNE